MPSPYKYYFLSRKNIKSLRCFTCRLQGWSGYSMPGSWMTDQMWIVVVAMHCTGTRHSLHHQSISGQTLQPNQFTFFLYKKKKKKCCGNVTSHGEWRANNNVSKQKTVSIETRDLTEEKTMTDITSKDLSPENRKQCCGSGWSVCFWASWIRIRGSGSNSTRYGSGTGSRFFYNQEKNSKKNLNSYCFVTSLTVSKRKKRDQKQSRVRYISLGEPNKSEATSQETLHKTQGRPETCQDSFLPCCSCLCPARSHGCRRSVDCGWA